MGGASGRGSDSGADGLAHDLMKRSIILGKQGRSKSQFERLYF